jgi:hypothetical protein
MQPAADGTYVALLPLVDCEGWTYEVRAETISGRILPEPGAPDQCVRMTGGMRAPCGYALAIEQEFRGCEASPDQVFLRVSAHVQPGSRVEVERGPADAPVPVGSFVVPSDASVSQSFVVDVRGEPEGGMPVRARAVLPNLEPESRP